MQNDNQPESGFFSTLTEISKNILGYVETRIELLKLDFYEAILRVFSSIICIVVCGLILFISILMLEVALALYIGEQNGHLWVGMVWIGISNLLLVPVLYLLHKRKVLIKLARLIIENTVFHDHHSIRK
ncbi:MAG: phage holin family protein [Cytophagales bacterium]|nr:phage holin family protein [Cytophagales bacterium]